MIEIGGQELVFDVSHIVTGIVPQAKLKQSSLSANG